MIILLNETTIIILDIVSSQFILRKYADTFKVYNIPTNNTDAVLYLKFILL